MPEPFWIPTLNAFDKVLVMKSRTKPPANVPAIPQTIVIPPNIKSASVCQTDFSVAKIIVCYALHG